MKNLEQLQAELREGARALVAQGTTIRQEIGRLTAQATGQFHRTSEGLAGVAKAVLEGATQALKETPPDQADQVLRQVVEGLADGFQASAQAVRLTMEESEAAGKRFAREDVAKLRADLEALQGMFAESVGQFARRAWSESVTRAEALGQHARRALDQAKPHLESALRTLLHEPKEVGQAAWKAGTAAGRAAAGSLFHEISQRLDKMSQRFRDPPSGSEA